MKANISKCHLLVNKKNEVTKRIGDTEIKNSDYDKLLDAKLNFNEHLNDIIQFKKTHRFPFISNVLTCLVFSCVYCFFLKQ